jgi:hypothetical protein
MSEKKSEPNPLNESLSAAMLEKALKDLASTQATPAPSKVEKESSQAGKPVGPDLKKEHE